MGESLPIFLGGISAVVLLLVEEEEEVFDGLAKWVGMVEIL